MQSANPRDPRAARSQKALHCALLELLEEKSLDQITVRDITAKAGVGYATFFRHHATKEELLDDCAAEQIRRVFELSVPIMDAQNLRSATIALFSYINEHRALWSTLLTGGAAGTIREEFLRQAREVAAIRPLSDGLLPVDASVLLIVGSTVELLTWWLRQPNPLPIEQMAQILDEVVVSPAVAAANVASVGSAK